jgi:uncharacterized protein YbbC (DUF1343 family)
MLSGLDRLCSALADQAEPPLNAELMRGIRRSAGLLTHPAAVTGDLTSSVEALSRAGAGLMTLFGPEHGVRGEAPDGRAVPSGVDPRTGLPVHSLYRGGSAASNAPDAEMLRGLGVLIIDLQDVGARFYTFTSTLSLCMEAAARADVRVVVLDRPNPIGDAIEGPLLRPEFASFVGLHPLPIRHGCTIGELALLFHRKFGVGEESSVVEYAPATHTPSGCMAADYWNWIPPSPNMPTPATALVYPGTCLLEGTNVSEGRGTARPFEWLGAPWINAEALAERLQSEGPAGVRFRPVHFIPSASKWAGEACAGVQVHVLDEEAFRPVRTGVAILSALRSLWPEQFQWREAGGLFAVDRLAGTDRLRCAIDAGESSSAIASSWQPDEEAFAAAREAVRLYP